jgi:uncharacterized protein (TIGR04255 family)
MPQILNPFVDKAPDEVPLPNAPLVRVLMQTQFSPILRIGEVSGIVSFQEAIRQDYPELTSEQSEAIELAVGPGGVTRAPVRTATRVWQFLDAQQQWRVGLSTEFVSLEALKYSSRTEFLKRARGVLDAVFDHFHPAQAHRVGLRYINSLGAKYVDDIQSFIRPELSSLLTPDIIKVATHSVGDMRVTTGEGNLQLRYGLLPASGTVDPSLMPPIGEPRWFLDMDLFQEGARPFNSASITKMLTAAAERIYTVFRWAATPALLDEFRK